MRERVEKKRADDVARPAVEVDRAGTGWLYCKPFKHFSPNSEVLGFSIYAKKGIV